jgi:hypothetical protein
LHVRLATQIPEIDRKTPKLHPLVIPILVRKVPYTSGSGIR